MGKRRSKLKEILVYMVAVTLMLGPFTPNAYSIGPDDGRPSVPNPDGPGTEPDTPRNPPRPPRPDRTNTPDQSIPEPAHKGCSYSQNYPCPTLNTGLSRDSGGHAAPYCEMLSFNDNTCSVTRNLSAAYASMAAICAVGCFTAWFGTAARIACMGGSAALNGYEIYEAHKSNQRADALSDRADELISQNWGLSKKMVATKVIAVGAQAGAIATASAGSRTRNGACVAMGMNAIFSGQNLYTWRKVQGNSGDEYKNMCRVTNCNPSIDDGNLTGDQGLASVNGANIPNKVQDARSPASIVDFKDKAKADLKSGKLAKSLATGALKNFLGNPSPEEVQQAFEDFEQNPSGIKLADAIAEAQTNGIGSMLDKIAEASENAEEYKKVIDEIEAIGNQPSQYASTGSSSRSGKKKAGSPFSSLLGRKTAGVSQGTAKGVSFGGFKGDIWHAGTTKTIFEIVSDKTQEVADRVGQ